MIVVICVGVFSFLVNMFQPKIRGAEVNFGVVDEGAVEVSVYATGKVVPFAEEIITSPVSSKVLEVYKKSGDRVQKDEPLLQLDLETIRTEYETKKESLEMQLNKLDLQRKTIAMRRRQRTNGSGTAIYLAFLPSGRKANFRFSR